MDNLGIIFTKISKTPRKGVKKNIEEIKDAFSDEEMPFFENKYLKAERISTSQLSTFIIDRKDEILKENMMQICSEFIEKVGEYNHE